MPTILSYPTAAVPTGPADVFRYEEVLTDPGLWTLTMVAASSPDPIQIQLWRLFVRINSVAVFTWVADSEIMEVALGGSVTISGPTGGPVYPPGAVRYAREPGLLVPADTPPSGDDAQSAVLLLVVSGVAGAYTFDARRPPQFPWDG